MNPESSRVVFDTSAIVSAVLRPGSVPSRAFLLAQRKMEILVSNATLDELATVLLRPKFDQYINRKDIAKLLHDLARGAELVSVTASLQACRDPRDDKFLELAISGEADTLVTGDNDLLDLDPFRGVRIVTPRDFLDQDS